MKKDWIRRILMILLACVFLTCGGIVLASRYKYIVNDRLNRKAVESFTVQRNVSQSVSGSASASSAAQSDSTASAAQQNGIGAGMQTDGTGAESEAPEIYREVPIEVDFEALKEINPEIIGWIYCEDTVINFPVAQARDNDYYLSHSYDRSSNGCGTVFADAMNRRDFADSNTILYGHHLSNGSMFSTLENWMEQEYFDEHSVMWILTPEQDYRVELFSTYYISATGDAYTIIQEPTRQLDEYLAKAKERSVVNADVELDGQAKYVMLSTCAYVFELSRAVLHGKMVPVASAGGVPFVTADIQN